MQQLTAWNARRTEGYLSAVSGQKTNNWASNFNKKFRVLETESLETIFQTANLVGVRLKPALEHP